MQVGSLVECIKDDWFNHNSNPTVVFPVVGIIYTIRNINIGPDFIAIRVEEIVNPEWYGAEPDFDIEYFRELQPPMTISIDEIVKEGATA